ncbi:hypothetical protein EYZ11_004003 [Aspergillus tanneri]|uniref:BTB domain transcription factor n=1 Tax=Aspergillus tanneri TaxID=1220188 RepID=A0A4V3UPU6_9EURO|nr:uncharacterized protein ATNIH1004_007414 [Aspergillus tanneri]KAA8645993.1 hypothetical protein ATNIH1004_007414 [Aspergillus tanneri]THC96504.1 hypothetical protein EYZ11_004003 [Aspergillus tanneri]
MAPTRTSSRQAAQKAKEAIAAAPDVAGIKRKVSIDKGPEPKKEKKDDQGLTHTDANGPKEQKPEEPKDTPDQKPTTETKEEQKQEVQEKEEELPGTSAVATKPAEEQRKEPAPVNGAEEGVRKTPGRGEAVPSNILEKGVIYFFYRPRVNISDPESIEDVARSFIVLRPTPLGETLGEGQGPVDVSSMCRLIVLPKKRFPTTSRERDMAFVVKAGHSVKELQESFIAGEKYETASPGERTVPEARPYAEGVYAITSAKRASHLAYILTIPDKVGPIQDDFGLRAHGSWIVQSKNPKYPGPPSATLPKAPDYPESIHKRFDDYRWIPLQPEFIDYPNAQFLMIGETGETLGKAATADSDEKQPGEASPGEELETFGHENEERVESLRGDDTVYEDLGLQAQNYPKVPTTWHSV